MSLELPRRLAGDDDRSDFVSGAAELDQWLQRFAWENQRANNAVTWVTTTGLDKKVVGYYSLTTAGVAKELAPRRLQHRSRPQDLPFLLIARLAVDRSVQGRGVGAGLLRDALERCIVLSESVGAVGVLVHARDEEAKGFYLANGDFLESPVDPLQLVVPMKALRALFAM